MLKVAWGCKLEDPTTRAIRVPYLLLNHQMYKFYPLLHMLQGCHEVLEAPVWNTNYLSQHCSSPFVLQGKAGNHPKYKLHCPKRHKLHPSVFQRGIGCLSSCSPVQGERTLGTHFETFYKDFDNLFTYSYLNMPLRGSAVSYLQIKQKT